MRKILSAIMLFGVLLMTGLQAFADDAAEAKAFFESYVNAANNYSPTIEQMYSPNAQNNPAGCKTGRRTCRCKNRHSNLHETA